MFHNGFNLAARLAVIIPLLSASLAFAQSDDPFSEMKTNPVCKGCHGSEGELNPITGKIDHGGDTPEAIKLRSGTGNPAAGKDKSRLCQGCHGEDGNSYDPKVPKLSGQYGPYISKQLRNYLSGVRTHQIMNAMAATISDPDLEDISAYFASQPKMDGSGAEFNMVGQKLYFHSDTSRAHMACVNCHGIAGKGLRPGTSMFPVIGGQHKEYLLAQLMFFKNDDRNNSPNAIMNKIAQALTDEELDALAEYLSEQ